MFSRITQPSNSINFDACHLALLLAQQFFPPFIHHHLSLSDQKDTEIASLLQDSLYVDDFAGGAYDDDEAEEVYHTSQHIMNTGGFRLRKWHSNSPYIRDLIANDVDADLVVENHSDVSSDMRDNTTPKDSVIAESTAKIPPFNTPRSGQNYYVKILGLNWNVQGDEFYYDLQEMIEYAESLLPTKRSVLKFAAKIFDPIGFVTPFTVNLKILFQCSCTANVNWDDPLEGDQANKWNQLVKEFRTINHVHVHADVTFKLRETTLIRTSSTAPAMHLIKLWRQWCTYELNTKTGRLM